MAVAYKFGGGGADQFLLSGVLLGAIEELEFKQDLFRRRRPAVRANHTPHVRQPLQIAADGHVADAQFAREKFHGTGPVSLEQFLDSFVAVYLHIRLVQIRLLCSNINKIEHLARQKNPRRKGPTGAGRFTDETAARLWARPVP